MALRAKSATPAHNYQNVREYIREGDNGDCATLPAGAENKKSLRDDPLGTGDRPGLGNKRFGRT